jgi:ADP-heptose:LPS heptosyltransferase
LHGRGPQSHQILLDLHPRQLLAYRSPSVRQTRGGPVWRQAEHEVDRWCRLLAHAGIPADRRALGLPRPDRRVPETWTGATLIHPGAASAARRWPAERFAAVARREADQGHTVLVTGGPHEAPLAHRVARLAGLPSSVVVAGATDLLDLAALVASAGRVVCGDTGVAHLASAYATPSVVLFGPVPPARWGPPAFPRHGVLWAGTTGDPHGDHPDPGLLQIGVPDVLGELDRLRGLETMAMPTGSARRYERHDHLAVRRSD